LADLIAAHCSFKASIVAGDEREATGRTDNRSRRILNFGHTIGHALETVTQYRRFRHGEAVGYGMQVANELAKLLGLLPPSDVELVSEAISLGGPLPKAGDLAVDDIMDAAAHDKKNVAGKIQWVLLEGIGKPRIVSSAEIPPRLIRKSIRTVLQN
jgi:3-dehydroquinate synthase